ncbi:MAG: SURF1 family protein [Gammaproteobacteria bacterium]|nr:SURF1 family protein [Gammaproteobacteria bacterium]
MRLGKWQFRPGLWPTLATAVMLVVLVTLGFWQLRRADYKRMLLAQYHTASTRPPVSVNASLASGGLGALGRYQHVRAAGRYDSSRQVLLEDMQQNGQVGYQVLTPLLLEPGHQILLVNRGFIARRADLNSLPDVQVADTDRNVTGVLGILPVPGIRLGKTTVSAGWPKLLLYPRYRNLKELYGNQLLKPVLLLDKHDADGFVRDWQPNIGFPPVRHDAYALQWFAMAVALFIIWIVVNSKRITHE